MRYNSRIFVLLTLNQKSKQKFKGVKALSLENSKTNVEVEKEECSQEIAMGANWRLRSVIHVLNKFKKARKSIVQMEPPT